MPYVRPVGQGVTASIAHQPLALPRTKHRPTKRENDNDASSASSSPTDVAKEEEKEKDVQPPSIPAVHVAMEAAPTPMPDFGSLITPDPSLGLSVTDDLPTPRAGSTPPLAIPHTTATSAPYQTDDAVLATRLASTSLDSEVAPSLSSSTHQSPASTSITSLSDQEQEHERLDPDSFENDDDDENEGEVSPPTSISGGAGAGTPSISSRLQLDLNSPEMDAFVRYRQGLVAYTKSLYIQAQLTNSREEKKRLSTRYGAQFGIKPSGMQKIAERKALARRLNG